MILFQIQETDMICNRKQVAENDR